MKILLAAAILIPSLFAQSQFDKARMKGGPGAQMMPRPNRGPWWDGQLANDINLTDSQRKQILLVRREFRGRLLDLRAAVDKAETDLTAAYNEDPVDPRKANEAIDRLVAARGELFRATSQMELRMRSVLTTSQWQELQKRQREDRPNQRRRPGAGGPPPNPNQQK